MATLRDTFDTIDPLPTDSLDGWSLPAWTYSDPDFAKKVARLEFPDLPGEAVDAAIDAVNTGAIYKYITKPWEVPTLETTLKRSLEFFMVQRERDALVREKLSVLHNLVITDRVLSLGVLASGLGDRYRNALPAVRAFLSLAPDFLRGVPMDLSQLRQPDFWEVFHQHIGRSVQLVGDMLTAPAGTGQPILRPPCAVGAQPGGCRRAAA